MPDFLFACFSCTQVSSDAIQQKIQQNFLCSVQESEYPSQGGKTPAAESDSLSACIGTPEVFQSTFAPRTASQDRTLRQPSDDLISGFQAIAPGQSSLQGSAKQSGLPNSSYSTPETAPVSAFPIAPLSIGSHHQSVAQLQARLRQLGYSVGAVDGLYGSQTRSAVMAFQRSQGLAVDGIVGLETWTALEKFAPTNSSAPSAIAANPAPAAISPPEKSQNSAERDRSPVSSLQQPDSHPVLFPPEAYPWLLGWAIVYTGGWLVIINDAVQQQRGYRKLRSRPGALKSSLQKPKANQPPAPDPLLNEQVSPSATANQSDSATQPDPPAKQSFPIQDTIPDAVNPSISAPIASLPEKITPEKIAPEKIALAETDSAEIDEVLEVLPAGEMTFLWLPGLLVDFNPPPVAPPPIASPIAAPVAAEPEMQLPPLTEEEMLMLTFAMEEHGIRYAYSLVDDAGGVFVLRGNELLLKPQHLEEEITEKTVTLRRTDTQGQSSEQSFKFQLQKTPTPQPAYAV